MLSTKIRPGWSKSLISRIFTVEFSFLFFFSLSPYHVNNSGGRVVGWKRTVPVVVAREDFVNEHPVLTSAQPRENTVP